MKSADGTRIAERWAKMYKRLLGDPYADYAICDLIEELSRSEERERVLRGLLEQSRFDPDEGMFPERYAEERFAALSTPAPEQRPFCSDCDHGVIGGKVCELCGGTGYVTEQPKENL